MVCYGLLRFDTVCYGSYVYLVGLSNFKIIHSSMRIYPFPGTLYHAFPGITPPSIHLKTVLFDTLKILATSSTVYVLMLGLRSAGCLLLLSLPPLVSKSSLLSIQVIYPARFYFWVSHRDMNAFLNSLNRNFITR